MNHELIGIRQPCDWLPSDRLQFSQVQEISYCSWPDWHCKM